MKFTINLFFLSFFSFCNIGILFSQEETNYVKWSVNFQGNYLIQNDVGVNTSTSFFEIQNTILLSGGVSYQVIKKDKYEIWAGVNILNFSPKVAQVIKSNGIEYDLFKPPPEEYENAIWRIPITYKGGLLEFLGLNEFLSLSYNIPNYKYEIRTRVFIDNNLLYETNVITDKNFFSTALGLEKEIFTKPLLFEIGAGYSFDLNTFYYGTLTLGDGTNANYNLVSNGPFLNLSIRPKKFRIISK